MKHLSLLALACLPVLVLALAPTQAQEPIGRAKPGHGLAPLGPVYTGHAVDGDLQTALNDALSKAQQGVADSSMISDATFAWDLSGIHGVRGGLMGLQDVWVEVTVR